MRTLDLFAGIGGFSLAAHWMGWETAAFVEWDPFCQKVLSKNFPNVPIYGDIKAFHYEQEKERIGPIDLICGGFPCQPFSHAGKRNGTADDRYLWPEMLRVIREVRPAWVVGENVAGLLSMDGGTVFEEVCTSLENEGYAVESFVIPACAVGAPHRRDRVWIVAHAERNRRQRQGGQQFAIHASQEREGQADWALRDNFKKGVTPDPESPKREQPWRTRPRREGFTDDGEQSRLVGVPNKPRLEGRGGHDECTREWIIGATGGELTTNAQGNRRNSEAQQEDGGKEIQRRRGCGPDNSGWNEHWYEAATRICGVHDGIPRRVDRSKRLKALGNAIVPQVVYEIFRAIDEI